VESIRLCGLLIPVCLVDCHGSEDYKRCDLNRNCKGVFAVINSKLGFLRRAAGVLVGVSMLTLSGASLATEQSKDRQAGRDVKQDAKQQARVEKAACKAGDEKSRSECRQDKRDTKQEGREDKRETKRQ
jgi:hypothetical protein